MGTDFLFLHASQEEGNRNRMVGQMRSLGT